MINRKLININTPSAQPGFLGQGHTARPVVGGNYSQTDPFIMLMDDLLDKKDTQPAGGPHPHAGFETVSLLLEGEIGDANHTMKRGDFQMMTAGSGIIHTETIDKKARMRLLQLWLNLPKEKRAIQPRVQDIPYEHVPALSENGVVIKLYSGSMAGLTSPVQNHVPVIIADISIQTAVTTSLQVPANYNTFIYVLQGTIAVGEEKKTLGPDQVGWLDLFTENESSELLVTAVDETARIVLYAGKPVGENIISHGPFIADSEEDIRRLYREYREGKMAHISTVPSSQRIVL